MTHRGLLDIDQLTARLLEEVSNPRAASSFSGASPPAFLDRSPTLPPRPDIEKDLETAACHELVEDGGRPLYPLGLLDQVSLNPGEYRDMLRPWLMDPDSAISPDDWRVFSRQLDRWRKFREWQLDNRNVSDEQGFPAFLEAEKREMALMGASTATTQPGMDEAIRKRWEEKQQDRQLQRIHEREVDGGFPEYAEAAKRRLAHHGFTQPLHLEEDPKRQDKRTTWIEYLSFEYWWLDKHSTSVKGLQQQHYKHWGALVDSKVLRPSESPKNLCTEEGARERAREQAQAENNVLSAKAILTSAQKATGAPRHGRTSAWAWTSARTRLSDANVTLEAVKNRNRLIRDFIQRTQRYRTAEKAAWRHGVMISWILEQASQIEVEQSKEAGTRGRKRRHPAYYQETMAKPSAKKQKQGGDTAQGRRRKRADFDDSADDGPRKRTRVDKVDQIWTGVVSEEGAVRELTTKGADQESSRTSQRPRRRARLATGADSSESAAARCRAEWLKSLRSRLPKEPAQPPAVQARQSKPLAATKVVKRKGGGQVVPESGFGGRLKKGRRQRQRHR